jgi:hypothetical protein
MTNNYSQGSIKLYDCRICWIERTTIIGREQDDQRWYLVFELSKAVCYIPRIASLSREDMVVSTRLY